MEIFYEKSVPKTATKLSEKEVNYLERLIGQTGIDGLFTELDSEITTKFISRYRELELKYKKFIDDELNEHWKDLTPFDISDETFKNLIEKFGTLSHSIYVSGETLVRKYHSESYNLSIDEVKEIEQKVGSASFLTEEDIEQYTSIDLGDIEWNDEDLEEPFPFSGDEGTTTLKITLPKINIFADLEVLEVN